ncbi:ricin-type beta-trefoil lectin domain protein [Saccharothrix sp. Mg75]|uniref:ricin-type beta-trefoil lectin domain protein n=1 Tax=Saccharothrix sp. Mg75 TaxID=3445357 RepID=UPI003EED761F
MRTEQPLSAEGGRPGASRRLGRRVKWVGVLAVLAAVAAGVPASAVSGGTEVPAGAHRFLARVVVGEQACSGALVSPQWVLTAARCLPPSGVPAGATASLGDVAVATGAGTRTAVVDVVRHTDRDLALLRLENAAAGTTPVQLGTTPPAVGESLLVAGFGRTSGSWVPNRPHAAAFTVTGVGAGTASLTGPGGTDTCKGDAGGPALRAVGGGVELVAVHSTSWQHGCLDVDDTRQGSTETRTDDVADWIGQHADPSRARFGRVTGTGGLCLDVNNGFDDNGTGFGLFGCHDQDHEQNGAQAFTATSDGALRVLGKCVDVYGPLFDSVHRYAVLWPCNGTPAQQWRFNADGSVTNVATGLCLDGTFGTSGSRVISHGCHGGPNQEWAAPTRQVRFGQVVGVGGMCLDVSGGRDDAGTGFGLHGCHASYSADAPAQGFTATDDGALRVLGKCVDVYGPLFDSVHRYAVLWPCNGTPAQQWRFNADGSVTNVATGLCLDGTFGTSGSRVISHGCHGGPNQEWAAPTRLA